MLKKRVLWQCVDSIVQVHVLAEHQEPQGVVSAVIHIIVLLIKSIQIKNKSLMEWYLHHVTWCKLHPAFPQCVRITRIGWAHQMETQIKAMQHNVTEAEKWGWQKFRICLTSPSSKNQKFAFWGVGNYCSLLPAITSSSVVFYYISLEQQSFIT